MNTTVTVAGFTLSIINAIAALLWAGPPGSSTDEAGRTADLVALRTAQGRQLLHDAEASDYIDLSTHFVTQDNLAYCGVASSVMVLNASGIERPASPAFGSYRLWTQDNFWTASARREAEESTVRREGMTLATLGKLLRANGLQVEVLHAETQPLDEFRRDIRASLRNPNAYVLVNYDRTSIGQAGGGHISPVGAYHEATDRFLILDVARYRYEPVWVTAEVLHRACRTVDSSSGRSRGFAIAKNLTSHEPTSTSPATAPTHAGH